jgi:hypothetical protein
LIKAVPRFIKPTLHTLATPDAAAPPAAAYKVALDVVLSTVLDRVELAGFCSVKLCSSGLFGSSF